MFPDEVRALLTARIAAMSVLDSYRQTSDDAWRESEDPLVPELAPLPGTHLCFFVDDRTVDDTGTAQSTWQDAPQVWSPVVVRFMFGLRPASRKTDWDAAGRAAVHVLRQLLADGWSEDVNVQRPAGSRVVSRSIAEPSDWVVVEVRVQVHYPLSLSE